MLRNFLEADLSFLDSGVCCLGEVLVLLDLKNGLASDILIKKGGFEFNQPLDYMAIPFRCNRCHSYSHLIPKCTFPFSKSFISRSVPKTKSFWRVKSTEVLPGEKYISVYDEVLVEGLVGSDYVSRVDKQTPILDTLKPLRFTVTDNPNLLLENFMISRDGGSGDTRRIDCPLGKLGFCFPSQM